MSTEADRTNLSAFADAIRNAEYVTFQTHKREDGAHILVRLTEARTEALRQAVAAWERREGAEVSEGELQNLLFVWTMNRDGNRKHLNVLEWHADSFRAELDRQGLAIVKVTTC